MYNVNFKNCLIRLVNHLKLNQENDQKEITLLLGAGCSLSSSNQNITTSGIIRDLVACYSDENENIPKEWVRLYEKFVNNVWSGQGELDRVNLLKKYFENMNPSEGYQCIRTLVENNYINNIITTNFDTMLDQVFDGLSYHLQVGTRKKTIGNNPQFTLLKAHGDLNMGQLRFSPSELYKLPQEIEETIKELSNSILIVVGFRGQDMGIIQALNSQENHCAYWITYDQPDFYNDYENGAFLNWLKKRNSERNFLFGNEYGDFDIIFKKIVQLLEQHKHKSKNSILHLWENSYVNNYLCLNLRLQKIFVEMLSITTDIVSESAWKSCSPYYADTHNSLIASVTHMVNDKIFSNELLYCISNEINSLLFAMALEIWCCCQGYNFDSTALIRLVRKKYEKQSENPHINEEFWEALQWLCSMTVHNGCTTPKEYYEITISFDLERNFEVILKKISLIEFATLFLMLQRLLLFTKTSGKGNEVIGVRCKKNLETHLYQLLVQDKDINIQLSKMTAQEYQELFDTILSRFFAEQVISSRRILYSQNVYVYVNIEESHSTITLGLMDEICQKSLHMKTLFLESMQKEEIMWDKSYMIIDDFMNSNSNGLFISGDSGVGKTWFLRKFVSEVTDSKFLVFPISGKQIDLHSDLVEYVLNKEWAKDDKLKHIDMLVKTRQQQIMVIIDGLNEIDANFQQILALYKSLIDFCDNLAKRDLNSIRLIITCRTEFYYQIRDNSGVLPSASSFYSVINETGDATTIYQFPRLNDSDIANIIHKLHIVDDMEPHSLREQFGDIIYIPVYLNIICKMISNKHSSHICVNEHSIYNIWYLNLQQFAQAQQCSVNLLNKICYLFIRYKYFSAENEVLTTANLFMEFPDSTEKLTATLEWMVLNKVIKQPQFYQNTILFAHDKIEEFFLTEYIQFYYKEELLKGFSQISLYYLPSPIVQNCIYGLLEMVLRQNKDSFIKHAISVIVEKNQVLVMLTVRLLLENDTQLYKIIKEVEQFVCRRDLEDFIYTMLEYMEMKIDHYESFSLTAMQNIHHYIHSSVIGNSLRLLALNNYIYAKYIWAFPIETEEISYDTAIALCKKVSTFDKEMLPTKLLDKNNRLLAILLRNSGQLNEAAELMNCVYNSLYENAYFDDACQALLDLGAIYRELTWFDKALDIYKKYPIEFVTDLQLKNRLYMHMGIIYKNKAQNALFSQDKNYDTICQKYKKAKELFEQVYMYADEAHLIPLLLEILAELVETMVIGYHLNLATIADVAGYMEKMDTLLPKYPVPVRRIQNCRMWARVLTLRGQFVDAISKLKDGFQIAIHYNIPFRAADCCNQISGILCDNINSKFITRELLMEGIEACQYSINYYSQLKQSRHLYLSDTHKKLKKLNDALKEFG